MTNEERLYDAFGELVYAVALADGYIQPEETEALERLLTHHDWAKEIKWSFDYEVKAKHSVEDVYKKAINTFEKIGPHPEYAFMLEVLDKVATASHGVDRMEEAMINQVSVDLKERFSRDLERMKRLATAHPSLAVLAGRSRQKKGAPRRTPLVTYSAMPGL